MAPFSIPAPRINPLQAQASGTRRTIDIETRIELVCETYLDVEIFYTLDGTRPQPYAGIVQGSRLFKYAAPFCLPPGKISIKAMALNAKVRTMRSNVVTKCFEVLKSDTRAVAKKVLKRKKKKTVPQIVVSDRDLCRPLFGDDDCEELLREETNGVQKDVCLEEPSTGVENIPLTCDATPSDEATSESSQSPHSSAQEGENPLNIATCESAQETPVSSAPQSPVKKPATVDDIAEDIGDGIKVENKSSSCNIKIESPPCCVKCDAPLQYCVTCNAVNTIASNYCIQCGQKLMLKCTHCKELNYVIATFCQFCGHKLELVQVASASSNPSSPSKSKRSNKSVQESPSVIAKQTQTLAERKAKMSPQKPPSRSPGRGYWHQQVDYICNHLKSYAYNNNEFRESISEPMLSDFQAAKVTKSEDSVIITLQFTPFTPIEKQ